MWTRTRDRKGHEKTRDQMQKRERIITRVVLYSALLQIKIVYVAINFHESENQAFLKIKKL